MGHGVQSWMRTCPYCGKLHRVTNFMIRRVYKGRVVHYGDFGWNEPGVEVTDTHLIACKRALQAKKEDN
jgi:hypothetical protein